MPGAALPWRRSPPESLTVAGEDGYERATITPSLDQTLEGLAGRVMDGLIAAWQLSAP